MFTVTVITEMVMMVTMVMRVKTAFSSSGLKQKKDEVDLICFSHSDRMFP